MVVGAVGLRDEHAARLPGDPGVPDGSGDSTREALVTGPKNPPVTPTGVGSSTITAPLGASASATRAVAM